MKRNRAFTTRPAEGLDVGAMAQGWTLHQIAHLFNRAHTSVRGVWRRPAAFDQRNGADRDRVDAG